MKVRALEIGFDNVALRQPGEEFEVPESVFEGGGKHWFEPVEQADKDRVAQLAKAAARKAVPVSAVDPAKQQAEYDASIKALNEKHAVTLKALQDELDQANKALASKK